MKMVDGVTHRNKAKRSDTGQRLVRAGNQNSVIGWRRSFASVHQESIRIWACRRSDTGQTNYMKDGGILSEATTGVGMLVEQFLDKKSDSPFLRSAASHLDTAAEGHWERAMVRTTICGTIAHWLCFGVVPQLATNYHK